MTAGYNQQPASISITNVTEPGKLLAELILIKGFSLHWHSHTYFPLLVTPSSTSLHPLPLSTQPLSLAHNLLPQIKTHFLQSFREKITIIQSIVDFSNIFTDQQVFLFTRHEIIRTCILKNNFTVNDRIL